MKLNYSRVILFGLFCISLSMKAQTLEEKKVIVKDYDVAKLEKLKLKYSKDFNEQKNKAIVLAQQNGWQIKFTENGSYYELVKISEEGKPLYYKTSNVDAAVSTRTNFLHNGGGIGLNVEGQGMTAHVWDGGLARTTHQEYDGVGGDDRFSIGDESTELDFHAAHVTGTIIASGFDAASKGMAPQAKAVGYDWNDDLSEATSAAANGMLISNHSYGYNAENVPDWEFGAYTNQAAAWDNLMYNAPFYLQVTSAGNDGNDAISNESPLEDNNQFDKLSYFQTAKNNLVIASSLDAVIDVDGTLLSVDRSTFSSEGPTDDLRIKPDLMGNGTGLYSSYETADDAYNTISGTSMSSPNVAGSLLLLQQYYKETNGVFMKAATLKGLVLHTADDTDILGPDPHAGWGLLNTKVAAEAITENGFGTYISEEVLSNGESYSITVKSDGITPLLTSISWTDKSGVISTGVPNEGLAVLVNDLDVKVTRETEIYSPWRLTGVYSNEKGDNTVDPFERVDVEDASGTYTITVTHKGTLEEAQNFSLIVSGVASDIAFKTSTAYQKVCSDKNAIFDFSYTQNVVGTTTFSSNGLPDGANLVFSAQTIEESGDFVVTINNLKNVLPGEYPIEIIADNGDQIKKRKIKLKVLHPDFSNYLQIIDLPINGSKGRSAASLNLSWLNNNNAESYLIEVSETPSFNSIIASGIETGLNFVLDNLTENSVYYWRVRPDNNCGNGIFSEIYSFQTGITDCTTFSATDFSSATIGATDEEVTAYVPIPISITGDAIINSITVTTDITHARISDLIVYLQEPAALGSNGIILLRNPCGTTFADISNTTFDDSGDALVCAETIPAISGTIAPEAKLASAVGKVANGTWYLAMFDQVRFQGGQINAASITVCTSEENTNIPAFTSSEIVLEGNTSYLITAANMNASSEAETEAQQQYTLVVKPEIGALEKEGVVLSAGDTFTQADITAARIKFVNSESGSFTDQFTVDIINAANGWLGNQIISIAETVLKTDNFLLNAVSFWPNPTKGILYVKLNKSGGKNVSITIFDIQGRAIMHTEDATSNSIFTKEIDTKNIASGIYLLSVVQGNKKVTKKILVAK
jgi:subtilisin-like proprotein convertase family protein